MIELVTSIVDMTVTAVCTIICFCYAFSGDRGTVSAEQDGTSTGRREWILLGFFMGEYFLGNLFSALYVVFLEKTPVYSNISDLTWYTSYLFIILLLIYISERKVISMISRLQLLIPVFTVSTGVFFVIRGEKIISNIIFAVIMTVALWLATGGLLLVRQEGRAAKKERVDSLWEDEKKEDADVSAKRPIYLMCLIVLLLEYGFWVICSFWMGDTLANPYFWDDILFCISLVCMIPAMAKAVGRDKR